MKKLSKEQINRNLSNVKASLAVEGQVPSRETLESGKKYLQGELSSKEAIHSITKRLLDKKERLQ